MAEARRALAALAAEEPAVVAAKECSGLLVAVLAAVTSATAAAAPCAHASSRRVGAGGRLFTELAAAVRVYALQYLVSESLHVRRAVLALAAVEAAA